MRYSFRLAIIDLHDESKTGKVPFLVFDSIHTNELLVPLQDDLFFRLTVRTHRVIPVDLVAKLIFEAELLDVLLLAVLVESLHGPDRLLWVELDQLRVGVFYTYCVILHHWRFLVIAQSHLHR